MSVWARVMYRPWLVALVALSGCAQGMHASALFTAEVQVEAGDGVWFDQELIGEVERAAREEDATRVFLSLQPDQAAVLRRGAAAMPVNRNGVTAIEILNSRTGREPLGDNAELVSLNNDFELIAWQTRETLDFTQTTLAAFTASMQKYFDSEDWDQQKKEIEQSLLQLNDDMQSAVMGLLRELEALQQELQAKSEQRTQEAERRLTEVIVALQLQIQSLLQSGQSVLADSLQQLLDMLEQEMKRHLDREEQQKTSETTV